MIPRLSSVILVVVCAGLGLGGCASFEPWVKPYERANLADPLMKAERDPIASGYLQHVHDAREAARGGTGGGGGGCGCN